MPTKTLSTSAGKTPCAEGSATWDLFQMQIHGQPIDAHGPSETVKQIPSIGIEPGVKAGSPWQALKSTFLIN